MNDAFLARLPLRLFAGLLAIAVFPSGPHLAEAQNRDIDPRSVFEERRPPSFARIRMSHLGRGPLDRMLEPPSRLLIDLEESGGRGVMLSGQPTEAVELSAIVSDAGSGARSSVECAGGERLRFRQAPSPGPRDETLLGAEVAFS